MVWDKISLEVDGAWRCFAINTMHFNSQYPTTWKVCKVLAARPADTHTDWSYGFSAVPQHPRAGRGEGFVLRYLRGMAEIKLNYSENLLGEILSLMWQIWLIALKVT